MYKQFVRMYFSVSFLTPNSCKENLQKSSIFVCNFLWYLLFIHCFFGGSTFCLFCTVVQISFHTFVLSNSFSFFILISLSYTDPRATKCWITLLYLSFWSIFFVSDLIFLSFALQIFSTPRCIDHARFHHGQRFSPFSL